MINSALLEIKRLIESPAQGFMLKQEMPSPSVPVGEPPRKQLGVLFGAGGEEVAHKIFIRPNSFGAAMPDAHVFVQNDNDMMEGFL